MCEQSFERSYMQRSSKQALGRRPNGFGNRMEWESENRLEQFLQYSLLGSACLAILAGYLMSSYRVMLAVYLIGAGITVVITVPQWEFFYRHPLEWWEPLYYDIPSTRVLKLRQGQYPHLHFVRSNPYAKRP